MSVHIRNLQPFFFSSSRDFSDSKFVVLFGSTALLIGPGQQMRMMFDSARVYATAIYLGCVVIALICALWVSLLS